MFKYFPHTEKDIKEMLKVIGVKSLDDLFSVIPKEIKDQANYNLNEVLSEYELMKHVTKVASKNKALQIFRGAGAYDHYTPAVIPALTSRGEFLTSYTPYQPEVSQGTLQYIFEFQSFISELTGMDVANASVYDGATAAAEAMLMAVSHTRRKKVLVSSTVNPTTIKVLETYAEYRNIQVDLINSKDGVTVNDFDPIDYAALIVAYPNYFGIIEDYHAFARKIHDAGALFIMITDPQALAVLKSPGSLGADIVVGDGQTLGIPLQFGGPYVGFMATKKALMRRLPGRICGVTMDKEGKRGFVLTLQTREQHIRREKATSNICSNQSLMALSVTIYMSLMGKDGLEKINELAYTNATYLKEELLKTKLFSNVYSQPFIKEFVLEAHFDVERVEKALLKKGYLTGLHLGNNHLLFAVTEKYGKPEIDSFVKELKNAVQ